MTARQGGPLPAVEPGIAWEARLPISRHAEPSQEQVRAGEGPQALVQLPDTLSPTPTLIQLHTPGLAHLRRTQTTLPGPPPACAPGALRSLPHTPFTWTLSQPWHEGLCQDSRHSNAWVWGLAQHSLGGGGSRPWIHWAVGVWRPAHPSCPFSSVHTWPS